MEITATEARKNWAQIMRWAEGGRTITITRSGRPVACIGPPKEMK